MKILIVRSALLMLPSVGIPSLANAQVAFGVRGTVAWNNMSFGDTDNAAINDLEWETTSALAPQFAMFVDVPVSQRFSVVPELGYQQRGYRYGAATFPGFPVVEQQLTLDYMEMNVLGKIYLSTEHVRPHLLLGPGLGRMLGARNRTESNPMLPGTIGTVLAPDDLRMQLVHVGLTGGAGFTFSAGRSWIGVEGRYQYGFTNIWNGLLLADINGSLIGQLNSFDRSVSVCATWMFPLTAPVKVE